jgi:2',3'-cyclic-nucleotide 2'-phosphodiesterase (5'-nucleotidase family)
MKTKTLTIAVLSALLIAVGAACTAQETARKEFQMSWKKVAMDGSRTGVIPVTAENVDTALGHFNGALYVAPNGKRFRKGSVPAVARLIIDAQPAMARVKEVVGYAPEAMVREGLECPLYNMYMDQMMASVEKSSGKKVDIGFANTGGVRIDLPKGDILLDDILSMFPFKNYTCYVALKGKDVKAILQQMAKYPTKMMLGGAKVVFSGDKVKSALIDGKPIDDKKVYGVATLSFLLNGGDGFSIARNAVDLEMFEVSMSDFMLEYLRGLKAEGKEVVYSTDGRLTQE